MAYCAYCGSHVTEVSYAPCPSCGRPTNGAPPAPAVAARGSNTVGIVIGIVVVVLFLIAMAGIVAAIAIPNLLTAMERSKQKRTMADMRSLATAAEAFATDKNYYPPGNSAADLQSILSPEYIRTVPVKDGWGQSIRYECWSDTGTQCTNYAFGSGGKDMRFDQESLRTYTKAQTSNFDCDIIFGDGEFVQYPENTR